MMCDEIRRCGVAITTHCALRFSLSSLLMCQPWRGLKLLVDAIAILPHHPHCKSSPCEAMLLADMGLIEKARRYMVLLQAG